MLRGCHVSFFFWGGEGNGGSVSVNERAGVAVKRDLIHDLLFLPISTIESRVS